MKAPISLMLAASALIPTTIFAQTENERGTPVSQAYAQKHGVSAQVAEQRLGQLDEIIAVEKALTEKYPNQFGGLYVEHSPEFRVVVKMTGQGEGLLRTITKDPKFVVEQAEIPLMQLRALQERVAKRLKTDGSYYFAVEANIWQGKILLRTTDPDAVKADLPRDLAVNRNVEIIPVEGGMQNAATIYGGKLLRGTSENCTAGFNVLANGQNMILTAGHCDSRVTLDGRTFNVVERVYKNSETWGFDFQIMNSTSSHTYPNETYKTRYYRETITKTTFAGDLPLGWDVCAFGTATNPTSIRCGKLESKWERTIDNRGVVGVFFRASPPDGKPFVVGGDSGGPVILQNTAVGIIKGRGDTNFPNHMYFADIQGLMGYGGFQYYDVYVKTSP